MTARTSDDNVPTGSNPGLRQSEDSAPARDSAAVKSDEVRGADRPVLEVDTSGVTRSRRTKSAGQPKETAELDPLFGQDAAADLRARWDVVQRSFVDNPQEAVRAGDELVTEVIQALTVTFTEQRAGFGTGPDADQSSTEALRLALRRYRSFFERLLSI